MGIVEVLGGLFTDYTLRTVALGSATLGVVSGALGSYAMLRRQSLLGDAISHAALPGIAAAFLLTRSKAPLVLILGAAAAGWIGTLLIMSIVRNTRVKHESALGLVLSVFFGFGLVLLTFIQRLPDASQAGLDKFLFGQAATLLQRDVVTMAGLGLVALLAITAFWKEFKLLCFDEDFGRSLGFPMRFLDVLLTSLLVLAIVIGLQTVGVVLMSAMIVAPAAAARQWTERLSVMVALAALFGALAGVSGALVSSTTAHLPTGPTIILCVSGIVLVSLLFAPSRGLLWNWAREQKNRRRLEVEAVLGDLYFLALQHAGAERGHPTEVLRAMSKGHGGADRSLRELEARGFARKDREGRWVLTREGHTEAEHLAREKEGRQ
jgi:manganese/zinc/iron transport system permease protein